MKYTGGRKPTEGETSDVAAPVFHFGYVPVRADGRAARVCRGEGAKTRPATVRRARARRKSKGKKKADDGEEAKADEEGQDRRQEGRRGGCSRRGGRAAGRARLVGASAGRRRGASGTAPGQGGRGTGRRRQAAQRWPARSATASRPTAGRRTTRVTRTPGLRACAAATRSTSSSTSACTSFTTSARRPRATAAASPTRRVTTSRQLHALRRRGRVRLVGRSGDHPAVVADRAALAFTDNPSSAATTRRRLHVRSGRHRGAPDGRLLPRRRPARQHRDRRRRLRRPARGHRSACGFESRSSRHGGAGGLHSCSRPRWSRGCSGAQRRGQARPCRRRRSRSRAWCCTATASATSSVSGEIQGERAAAEGPQGSDQRPAQEPGGGRSQVRQGARRFDPARPAVVAQARAVGADARAGPAGRGARRAARQRA